MATERLIQEVKTGDLPKIDLGNFSFQPVDRVQALQARLPAENGTKVTAKQIAQVLLDSPDLQPPKALDQKQFPLNLLEDRIFAGTGYNTIWRPRSNTPIPPAVDGSAADVLELNLTAETLAFSKSLGDVPNRGVKAQEDLMLKGISYVQRVGAFENINTGSNDSKTPAGIHIEPGLLMFVPSSDPTPKQPATINRMASIPHGTTINAQGLAPSVNQVKRPVDPEKDIKPVSIIPFNVEPPNSEVASFFAQHLSFNGTVQDNRLPNPLTKFKDTITQKIFQDPNQVLRNALVGQTIESFVTFELTTQAVKRSATQAADQFVGGGTANIGFLQGTDDQTKFKEGNAGNAHAIKMTVRYWIETVTDTLTIKPKSSEPQEFRMVSAAGVLGPTFVVSAAATASLGAPSKKKVTWTQIQYSQNVTLNFNGLSWPHISVATLGDTSRIEVTP